LGLFFHLKQPHINGKKGNPRGLRGKLFFIYAFAKSEGAPVSKGWFLTTPEIKSGAATEEGQVIDNNLLPPAN
jgi:hypothetical protein